MKRLHRALLMPWAGGGSPYFLRDFFTTDQAAPITTPRTCEPGPGSLTAADPANRMSISSSKLTFASGGSAWDTGVVDTVGRTRAAGLAIIVSIVQTSGSAFAITWQRSQTFTAPIVAGVADLVVRGNSGNIWPYINGSVVATAAEIGQLSNGAQLALVLRSAGAFVLQNQSGTWKLLWVDNAQNTATLYPMLINFNAAVTADDLYVLNVGGLWTSDYGIATSRTASAGADATATMTADAIVEATWTAVTGETYELSVRRTDDNNRWVIRGSQGGSTIKIIEVNGGSETERATAAQTWTNGTQYRIQVVASGNLLLAYVGNAVFKVQYLSAAFNNTATGIKTSHAVTDLVAWPRNVPAPI